MDNNLVIASLLRISPWANEKSKGKGFHSNCNTDVNFIHDSLLMQKLSHYQRHQLERLN